MEKKFKTKIAWQIGIWFLILAILPMAIGTTISRHNNRSLIVQQWTDHLRHIVHEKIARIELYVEESTQSVVSLANVPVVVKALQQASYNFSEHGLQSESLPELDSIALSFLRDAQKNLNYHDIFLINKLGDIVYTLAKENDLGANLKTGLYRDSGLAWTFDIATTQFDSKISPFIYYPPSSMSAAFIAAPVWLGNDLLGAVAIQLDEDRMFHIFTDYIGLGKSGELVAGRQRSDGTVVAAGPLRNRPEALEKGLVFSKGVTLPILQATNGQEGAGLTIDYRGHKIVAAWDYIPSLNWGLVVKIDQSEAFSPIHRQDLLAGGLLLIAFLMVVSGILFATKLITNPIQKLIVTLNDFSGGNFKVRAVVSTTNEIGILATTFNYMAQIIDEYRSSMEALVAERTEKLTLTEKMLNRAQQVAHVGNWEWDIVNNGLAWSNEIYRIFGLKPQQFAATFEAFLEAVHPDDRELLSDAVQDALQDIRPYSLDHRVLRPDGSIRIVHEIGKIKRNEQGQPLSMLGTVQDVTQLRQAQQQLHQYLAIVDENVITSATDIEGTITYVSDAFCQISGYDREELLGNNHRILRHPDMPDSLYKQLWETLLAGKKWSGIIQNMAKDGHDYWVDISITSTLNEMNEVTGFTAIHNDITDKKKIEHLSITDELTGLYNRRHFNALFSQELHRSKRDGKNLIFIMFDVDHFKQYNDTYGHQKGDEVLATIGESLNKMLNRPSDFSFRLGGEEFGILAENMNEDEAVLFANQYCRQLEDLRVEHKGNSAGPYVTVSMGVAVITPTDQLNEDEIFKKVDDALYEAKNRGRNRVAIAR